MPEKYKKLTTRRKAMLEMRLQGKTLEAIGEKFGISRERVRQILSKLELGKISSGRERENSGKNIL